MAILSSEIIPKERLSAYQRWELGTLEEVDGAVLERRPLVHLTVACHQQVEVHDVAGRDGERGLELAIPGMVVDGRVENMLGHRSSSQ